MLKKLTVILFAMTTMANAGFYIEFGGFQTRAKAETALKELKSTEIGFDLAYLEDDIEDGRTIIRLDGFKSYEGAKRYITSHRWTGAAFVQEDYKDDNEE